MAHSSHLQMYFLPYLSLSNEIRIGNVIFWDFYKKKEEYIENQELKNHIEKIFKRYVDNPWDKKPLKNIIITSYKEPSNFGPLEEESAEEKEISDAVTILCMSTIFGNKGRYALSDNFQIIRQNFTRGDDGIAIVRGSYNPLQESGLKIHQVLFTIPPYIKCLSDYHCIIDYNEKILRAIEILQQDKNNESLYRRIINSFEWVKYAYTNADNFKYSSRIVMMAFAFEFLFDEFHGRWGFVDKIKIHTCNDSDSDPKNRETRTIETKKGREEKDCSLKEWWAYEFYILRNKIVHGYQLKTEELKNRKDEEYFRLSTIFFEECLKKILEKQNCYLYDEIDEMSWAGIRDEI